MKDVLTDGHNMEPTSPQDCIVLIDDSGDGGFYVTPKSFWDKEHCIYDQGFSGPVDDLLHKNGFTQTTESGYISNDDEDPTPEQIEKLRKLGFIIIDERPDWAR